MSQIAWLPIVSGFGEARLVQAVLDDARKRELQTVIQAYFKDWLQSSGNMRQVYDLARMEREEGGGAPPSPRSL